MASLKTLSSSLSFFVTFRDVTKLSLQPLATGGSGIFPVEKLSTTRGTLEMVCKVTLPNIFYIVIKIFDGLHFQKI